MGDGLGMPRSPLRSSKPASQNVRRSVPPGRRCFLEFSWSPQALGIALAAVRDHAQAPACCSFPKAHKRLDGKLNVAIKNKGAGGIGTVSTPGAMQSHE